MNQEIFADTHYWVALLNPRDQWHSSAVEIRDLIGDVRLVTTGSVLIELLGHFSDFGPISRLTVAKAVDEIIAADEIEYIPHQEVAFDEALKLYKARPDKGYSLTDCISMQIMTSRKIREVLTNDEHFEQEGFVKLL